MLAPARFVELPARLRPGGFGHAAVRLASARLFVAHTANDALEVIDTERDRHVRTIERFSGVTDPFADAGAGTLLPDAGAGS